MSDYGISKYLPILAKKNPQKVRDVVKYLEKTLGVPDQCSLTDVTVDDLTDNDLLKKIPARNLVKAWQNEGSSINPVSSSSTSPAPYGTISINANSIGSNQVAQRDMVINREGPEVYNMGTTNTTYNAAVDQSKREIKIGDHAQFGGSRDTQEIHLSDNAQMTGNNVNMSGTQTVSTSTPETLSPEEYQFKDDPGYQYIDPQNLKVIKSSTSNEDYIKHLTNYEALQVYRIRPWQRNRALIINIVDVPGKERLGAEKDSVRLEVLLKQLGFVVTVKENLNKEDILKSLDEFLDSPQVEIAPVVLLYVGSHGGRANNQDYFLSADNRWVSIPDEVVTRFSDPHRQASLAGKPKIFWFQFCRKDITPQRDSIQQPNEEVKEVQEIFNPQSLIEWFQKRSVSTDSDEEFGPNLPDMFVGCATIPGSFAYRDNVVGSWFVYAIGLVFANHACSMPLRELFTKVNEAIKKRGEELTPGNIVSVAEEPFCTFGTKKLRFYPH